VTLHAPRREVRRLPLRGRAPGALLFQALGPDGMDLLPRERAVFDALLDHRNHGSGRCNPAVPYLAHHLKMSPRTIQRALSALEAKGMIWTANRAGGWRYTTQWELRSSWWFHWRAGYEQRMALRCEAAGEAAEAERRRRLAEEHEALFKAEVEAEKRWMSSAAERSRLPWEVNVGSQEEPAEEEPVESGEPEASDPSPEPIEAPVPVERGEDAVSRASIREQWEAAWAESWVGRVPGQGRYHWPVGKRTSDARQHQAALGAIREHFETPGALRRAFGGYLAQEQCPPKRSIPRSFGVGGGRSYGVFPHDEAPSLPKFVRSIRTWKMHAVQAGGGGPGPPGPPGWTALPEVTRAKVLAYLGVTSLPQEVAATLEIPGYLEELVARSTG
jgi:DNA-binding transcriptional ArsR family regulator